MLLLLVFLAMFAIKRSQRKSQEINETSSTFRINHIVVEPRLKYFDRYWYRNPFNTDYNTIGSTIFSTLLWCWMNKDRQNEISHKCLLSCALHAMLQSTHFFLLSAVQLNCAHVNPFRLLHGFGFYAFEHWMHTIINKSSIQTIGFNRGFRLQLCYAFFIWLVFSLSLCCFYYRHDHHTRSTHPFSRATSTIPARFLRTLFKIFLYFFKFFFVHFIWLDLFFVSVSVSIVYNSF